MANWNPRTVPRVTDTVFISLGTVTLPSTAQFRALNLSGGVLNGAGTITNPINWSGGRLNATLTIASNNVLTISGAGEKILSSGTLVNAGRVLWSGAGVVRVTGSTSVTNQAGSLIEIQSDVTMSADAGANARIVNQGLIRKTGGLGVSAINGIPILNYGLVDLLSGTLSISSSYNNIGETKLSVSGLNLLGGGTIGGTWSTTTGAAISLLSGTYDISANTVYNGPGSFGVRGNVVLNGTLTRREFDLAGTISGSLIVTGRINWSSGQISGGLTIVSGGALNLTGVADKTLNGSMIKNAGTITWGGSGNILMNGGTVLTNQPGGVIDIQSDATLRHDIDAPPQLVNQGAIRKTSGTGVTVLNGIPVTNIGLVEVLNGTLVFGGTFTNTGETKVQSGRVNLMGGGRIAGTWTLGAGASANLTGGSFELDGNAFFSGPGSFALQGNVILNGMLSRKEVLLAGNVGGAFTIVGTVNWTEGQIAANLRIAQGGFLNLLGNGEKSFGAGQVNNFGSILWSGAGRIDVSGGAVFTNHIGSLFEIQVDGTIQRDSGDSSVFVNNGSFRKSMGTGAASINGIEFTNNGTLTVNSGTLNIGGRLVNTGSIRVEAGSLNLHDGGVVRGLWSAGSGTSINLVSGAFQLDSSVLFNGPGVFGVTGDAALSGNLNIPNFRLNGVIGGTFQLTSSITGNFTIAGTMNWTQGQVGGNMTIAPDGLVNVFGSQDKTLFGAVLNNAGMFLWSSPCRIRVSSGTIVTNLESGVFDIQSDSTMWHDFGAQPKIVNQGTVSKSGGIGTSTLSGIPFANSGRVEVEIGTLVLERAEFLEEGEIQITCANDGQYGRLVLPGEVTLRGGLDLVFLEPFRFWPSVTVIPISFSSHLGTFSSVTGQNLPEGGRIAADYRPTSVAVTVNPVPPGVATSKGVYTLGEEISVSFEDAPGNPKDRIAIFPQGISPATAQPVLWSYVDGTQIGTNGLKEGSVKFLNGLDQTGRWTVYLLWNDRTNIISQSAFQTVPAYSISLAASPVEGGLALGAGSFPQDSSQTIHAVPNEFYLFQSWTENGSVVSTVSDYTFVLDRSRSLVANFVLKPVQIVITSEPDGRTLMVDGEPFVAPKTFTWTPGEQHTLFAASPQNGEDPKTRYIFQSWNDDPAQTRQITIPYAPTPFVARFASQVLLETAAAPEGTGTISANPPGPWFDLGADVVLTALPANGYALASWTGVDSQNGAVAQVKMNGPKTVSASFEPFDLLVQVRITALNEVTVTFQAHRTGTYRLEASSDLVTWTTLASFSGRSGAVDYPDFDLPRGTRRFYRVARQ